MNIIYIVFDGDEGGARSSTQDPVWVPDDDPLNDLVVADLACKQEVITLSINLQTQL